MGRIRIDYVEIPVTNIARSKAFYAAAFGWEFTDWGDSYASFNDGRESGGMQLVDEVSLGGLLVILYADDLEASMERVERAGGTLSGAILEFPGGRRFSFTDPDGHELAVWTKQ